MGRLDYLRQFTSKKTVSTYMAALKRFFQVIYNVEDVDLEEYAERYFAEGRNYELDVQNFHVSLRDAPPKTRRVYIAAVKTFLLENNVELPQIFWRRISGRIRGSGPVSEERVPSRQQLRSIIMHLPVHGKALFLTLLSSGMRIGEALNLKISDIDLNVDPPVIRIRAEYTKTRMKRITFISSEAKESILEWLKIRDKYLMSSSGKTHFAEKKMNDDRLFPFTITNAQVMWRNALEKTGNGQVDPRTRRLLIRPHVLRKFFRAMLGKISVDMAEALMGHQGYLTEVYRKYPEPEKTLSEFYKQNEHLLLIFTDTSEIVKRQNELEERNRQLQQIINGLVYENMQLKTKLNELEREFRELKAAIEKMMRK